jgi:hypothetical protein
MRHLSMTNGIDELAARPTRDKWARSDKISLCAVIAATLAFLVSAMQPVQSAVRHFTRPRASIIFPQDGARLPDNTFGAWGTSGNIPASSDLWLVIRSGIEGRYYPAINLTLASNGTWGIQSNRMCPATGLQDVQVYLVPNTDENDLFAYIRSSAAKTGTGINSMPADAVLEASSGVVVGNSRPSC